MWMLCGLVSCSGPSPFPPLPRGSSPHPHPPPCLPRVCDSESLDLVYVVQHHCLLCSLQGVMVGIAVVSFLHRNGVWECFSRQVWKAGVVQVGNCFQGMWVALFASIRSFVFKALTGSCWGKSCDFTKDWSNMWVLTGLSLRMTTLTCVPLEYLKLKSFIVVCLWHVEKVWC